MTYTYGHPHPAVTTDIVVFTVGEDALKVLLVKRAAPPHRGEWVLPGGFVNLDEGLEESARRELEEETGVSGAYLEQLYTFGKPDRDPRERVITVAYYALIASDRLDIQAASDATDAAWFVMQELPALAFDHQEILDLAYQRLLAKLEYSTIAFQFMPAEFTLAELQRVNERVLGRPLDKRNFRKRVLALDLIKNTGKQKKQGAHRPASLYRIVGGNRVHVIG